MANQICRYEVDGGEITLTSESIRQTICNNPQVTDREVQLFMALCKAQKLNPFVKDAYLIKYGSKPATMVVGKDVYTKRAQKNARYKGMQAGLTFLGTDGKIHRREGSMLLDGEILTGGWCKVFVDGYEAPVYDEVAFAEYVGRKSDGTVNAQWSTKPGTMIRKVAIVHALREAFPEDFAGLYEACEMGIEEPKDDAPIDVPQDAVSIQDAPVYEDPEIINDEPMGAICEEQLEAF